MHIRHAWVIVLLYCAALVFLQPSKNTVGCSGNVYEFNPYYTLALTSVNVLILFRYNSRVLVQRPFSLPCFIRAKVVGSRNIGEVLIGWVLISYEFAHLIYVVREDAPHTARRGSIRAGVSESVITRSNPY